MRENIHPKYYEQAKVSCACGNTFFVGSTLPEIKVEICSRCHPFFTGAKKIVDTEGRVEKFRRKYGEIRSKRRSSDTGEDKIKTTDENEEK